MRRSNRVAAKKTLPQNGDENQDSSTDNEFESDTEFKRALPKKSNPNKKSTLKPNLTVLKKDSSLAIKNVNLSSDSSSDDEHLPPKLKASPSSQKVTNSSSSESDIENYLKTAKDVNKLNSSVFEIKKIDFLAGFEAVENNIFDDVTKIQSSSDAEEEISQKSKTKEEKVSKLSFQKLNDYARKLEEAKIIVEKYETQKLKNDNNKNMEAESDDKKEDILNLLAVGEAKIGESSAESANVTAYDSFSDSEKEDWEEIESNEHENTVYIPKEGVEVTVDLPGGEVRKKKRKTEAEILMSVKRRLNRVRKENQIMVHKVHLLCWLAHGNYVNAVLNRESVMSLTLSLISSEDLFPPPRVDLKYLKKIISWYKEIIHLDVENKDYTSMQLKDLLKLQINVKKAFGEKMFVYIFISLLRSLGLQCRLVLSFKVEPLKPPENELHSLSTKSPNKPEQPKNTEVSKTKTQSNDLNKNVKQDNLKNNKIKKKKTVSETDIKQSKDENEKLKQRATKSASKASTSNVSNKNDKQENNNKRKKSQNNETEIVPKKLKVTEKKIKSTSCSELKSSKSRKLNNNETPIKSRLRTRASVNIDQLDGADDSDNEDITSNSDKPNLKKLSQEESNSCQITKHTKRLVKKKPCYVESSQSSTEDDVFEPPKKKLSSNVPNLKNLKLKKLDSEIPENKIERIIPLIRIDYASETNDKQESLQKNKLKSTKKSESSKRTSKVSKSRSNSEDEFLPPKSINVKQKIKSSPSVTKRQQQLKVNKDGRDVWIEVYIDSENKWICVDLITGGSNSPTEIFLNASQPVTYVVAWNNNNSIRDVSQRYCPNLNTETRMLRVKQNWWEESIFPFVGTKNLKDRQEDEELAKFQLDKPLPTTISEYKNHPLYALRRHLLKYQALYPPNPVTFGFIRNEPVYSRDCVKILHSRENWFKEAKLVKPGEEPYKIVLRPKYDKVLREILKNQPLELFGEWQTEDYVPPPAENGIVPKNEYGNVELFKACMLPKGTVHLQLPNLNKVAKKLNIDCPPAMVGFDSCGGWPYPLFDGYVVCEEFSEVLICAWSQEQEEMEKREKEKTEKRVYDNWKKLIKGLLIRERLKARYNFGESSSSATKRLQKENKTVNKKLKSSNKNEESDCDSS